jgi:hypothetical protein
VVIPIDPSEAAEIEARSKQARIYFSSTCPPGERMKQTPEEEAAGKKYWDHYEKTREFLMNGPMPEKRVAGLMDVIDEDEELCYIDDGNPIEVSRKNPSASKLDEAGINPMLGEGQSSGLKSNDLIDFDSSEAEKPSENQSRSPPPSLEETERFVEKSTGNDAILHPKNDDTLQLEKRVWFFGLLLH